VRLPPPRFCSGYSEVSFFLAFPMLPTLPISRCLQSYSGFRTLVPRFCVAGGSSFTLFLDLSPLPVSRSSVTQRRRQPLSHDCSKSYCAPLLLHQALLRFFPFLAIPEHVSFNLRPTSCEHHSCRHQRTSRLYSPRGFFFPFPLLYLRTRAIPPFNMVLLLPPV